jgi:hypothetical protein
MPMSKDDIEESIGLLTGQMHALFMICQVLAQTHPNPEKFASTFEGVCQEGLAAIEYLPLKREDMISGYQHIVTGIRSVLPNAGEAKGSI